MSGEGQGGGPETGLDKFEIAVRTLSPAKDGGVEWETDELTYPAQYQGFARQDNVSLECIHFKSHLSGYLGIYDYDYDTKFLLKGSFFTADDGSPVMANVSFRLASTDITGDSAATLTFKAKAQPTFYGTPEAPEVRFVFTGTLDAGGGLGSLLDDWKGKWEAQYEVTLSVDHYGQVEWVDGRIVGGKGVLYVGEGGGFFLGVDAHYADTDDLHDWEVAQIRVDPETSEEPSMGRTTSVSYEPPVFPGEMTEGCAHHREVRLLQQKLIDNGAAIGVDGDFGPDTAAAVMAFQLARNLNPFDDQELRSDGVVDYYTWRALFGD